MRTGRGSDTSGERTTTISPRTPRRSGRASRAASPRQSTTMSARASCGASSTPKRIATPRSCRRSARAASARRGSRWASSGKNSARRKRPARSGSSAAMPIGVQPFEALGALGKAREVGAGRAAGRPPGCRCAPSRGSARPTSRSTARPSRRPRARSVARSHHGASMPPAIHEQLPSPSARPRSTTSTPRPRSASSSAQVEAGNAGADDDDGWLGQSLNSRSFAGMTRIRFKGFSPTGCLSPGSLAETGHPSDVLKESAARPLCQELGRGRKSPHRPRDRVRRSRATRPAARGRAPRRRHGCAPRRGRW